MYSNVETTENKLFIPDLGMFLFAIKYVSNYNQFADRIQHGLTKHYFNNKNWEQLGLRLGLYKHTIEMISSKRRDDYAGCLSDILFAWLRKQDGVTKKGEPTLISLTRALKDINEKGVAEGIEKGLL